MRKLTVLVAALSAATVAAQANLLSGELWHVSAGAAGSAVPANVPASPPDVTFDVNSPIDFNSSSGYTVGAFLTGGGAFGIVEHTAGTLASSLDNTLIEFTGTVTVTTGETFTVTHDDGLTLIIGGLNLGFNPGPTAPTTTTVTYTGPSGNLPFELVYAECCGPPAVLQVSLPLTSTVPESGSTLGLLGAASAMIGAFGRRLRK